jgi:hypothetical protein
MWGTLLMLAFLIAIHPVRLGVTLLVISRPRPMQNLLAYWVGCVTVGLVALLIPLMVLHFTPALSSLAKSWAHPATNPTARHITIGMGVLTLSLAALTAVRQAALRRAHTRAHMQTPDHNTLTLVAETDTPTPLSRLLGTAQDTEAEGTSVFRRLLSRARDAWQNGSSWVAFVIGLAVGPSLDLLGVLFVLSIIMASGAAIGMQVSAGIAFIVTAFWVEEIALVSNQFAPAKTQAALGRLQVWALAHRHTILIAIFAVVGISLVAQGLVLQP